MKRDGGGGENISIILVTLQVGWNHYCKSSESVESDRLPRHFVQKLFFFFFFLF